MTEREKAIIEIKNRRKLAEEARTEALEALRKDASFDDLYREMNSMRWEFIKAKSPEAQEEIQRKIESAEASLNKIIKENGFPFSVSGVPYNCNLCKDTGTVDGVACKCTESVRKELALKENPILGSMPTGLKAIGYAFYGKDAAGKKACAEYIADEIKKEKRIFLFAGKTGTGKTYFAGSAVRGLLEDGKDVKAVSAIKLNKELLEYHCAPLEKKRGLWEEIAAREVMLIDDLGAEQVLNNVTIPYLLELLTERAEEKITFITTNLSPTELEKRYGQRIVSRLLDKKLSVAVAFCGDDLRLSGR